MYARLLRLKHVQPGSLLCALYFEGSVFVGALLAFAELVPWYVAVLLPIVVAVMVKLNDVIAGAVVDAPEPAVIEPDEGSSDEELDGEWEADADGVASEHADEDADEPVGEVTSGDVRVETGPAEGSRGDQAQRDPISGPVAEPDVEVDPASEDGRIDPPEQPGRVPAEPVSHQSDSPDTSPDQQAGTAGSQAPARPDVGGSPGEPDTVSTPGANGVPDQNTASGESDAADGVAGPRPAGETGGSGAKGESEPAAQEGSSDTGMATTGWLRVAGGLDHTTEFSAIRLDADGTPLPPGIPDREHPAPEPVSQPPPEESSLVTPPNGTDGYDRSGPAPSGAAPAAEDPGIVPPRAGGSGVVPPRAEGAGVVPPGPRRPASVSVEADSEDGQSPPEPVRDGGPTWRLDASGDG